MSKIGDIVCKGYVMVFKWYAGFLIFAVISMCRFLMKSRPNWVHSLFGPISVTTHRYDGVTVVLEEVCDSGILP